MRRKAARGEPASPPLLSDRDAPPDGDGGARWADDVRCGDLPPGSDAEAMCGVERERVGESCDACETCDAWRAMPTAGGGPGSDPTLALPACGCCAPLERPELADDGARSDADDLPPPPDALEPARGLGEAVDFGVVVPNETPESCRSPTGMTPVGRGGTGSVR